MPCEINLRRHPINDGGLTRHAHDVQPVSPCSAQSRVHRARFSASRIFHKRDLPANWVDEVQRPTSLQGDERVIERCHRENPIWNAFLSYRTSEGHDASIVKPA